MPFGHPLALVAILTGDGREGVTRLDLRAGLNTPLLARRVLTEGHQLPRLIPPPPRLAQANFGIGADGEFLFLAVGAVFQPLELSARRLNQQKQAQRIAHLVGLRLRFHLADRNICERHDSRHLPDKWPPFGGHSN